MKTTIFHGESHHKIPSTLHFFTAGGSSGPRDVGCSRCAGTGFDPGMAIKVHPLWGRVEKLQNGGGNMDFKGFWDFLLGYVGFGGFSAGIFWFWVIFCWDILVLVDFLLGYLGFGGFFAGIFWFGDFLL